MQENPSKMTRNGLKMEENLLKMPRKAHLHLPIALPQPLQLQLRLPSGPRVPQLRP